TTFLNTCALLIFHHVNPNKYNTYIMFSLHKYPAYLNPAKPNKSCSMDEFELTGDTVYHSMGYLRFDCIAITKLEQFMELESGKKFHDAVCKIAHVDMHSKHNWEVSPQFQPLHGHVIKFLPQYYSREI